MIMLRRHVQDAPEISITLKKKITPTMVQICRLENIEHKNMKQVSYSGKYSLSGSRAVVVVEASNSFIFKRVQFLWLECV